MAYFLNDEDVRVLKELVAQKQQLRIRTYSADNLPSTPEVYIAKTPIDGIPGMGDEPSGTGSVSLPGYADCDIYEIVDNGNQFDLVSIDFNQKVYNLSLVSIAGDTWVLIIRDKFGSWIVSSSGGSGSFWVEISSITQDVEGHYTGTRWSWDEESHVWVAAEVNVKIESPNGEILSLGIKYPAHLIGNDIYGTGTTGANVYAVYPGKSEVVKVTGPAVGGVYPAVLQKYNAGTWVDAEVVDVIEINGANLSGWAGGIYSWGSH